MSGLSEKAPHPILTTLIKWAAFIDPKTLEQLNERVVALARSLKVTRGRKLRTDGTVVEANIHHPSDSSLLSDGVRVLSRVLRRAKEAVGEGIRGGKGIFRDRTLSAKAMAHQIGEAARRRGEEAEGARRAAYRRLLAVAEATLKQARILRDHLVQASRGGGEGLLRQLDHFLPLVGQVVSQTRRRVLDREKVPASEKLVSIFEPHSAIIRRDKFGRPNEFGRKVWVDEVGGGIVSDYRILEGNPIDASQVLPSLKEHRRRFGRPPDLFAGDRGVYSPEAERVAREMGVRRVAPPKPGRKSPERQAHERQGWFRRARRFRAGSEGRISVLKRRGHLGRCRDHGEAGFGRWVGWGVLTANLSTIARVVATR